MLRFFCAILAATAALVAAPEARAAGTPAGTRIGNTATLSYQADGKAAAPISATAPPVVVSRLLSVSVTWQDSAPVPATSPDTDRVLAFVVTNTGNGTDTFSLSRDDAITTDKFDPVPSPDGAIWIESGAQPGLQRTGPNADVLYAPGVNDIVLPADASRTVYILSSIPSAVATGSFGKTALLAMSATQGVAQAVPGAAVASVDGVQSVVGAGGGRARGEGAYLVAGASLGLAKSVSAVRDAQGGNRVMTGSVLTYHLVLTLTGTGSVDQVVVNDPLPANVTYVPNSLTVDGVARTDAADGDELSFNGNAVLANFGTVAVPATRVIEFKVTVN